MTDFVKKVKLTELENKIPDVSNLATKNALTTVENKKPGVSNLVKKTGYNTKVTEIEHKLNHKIIIIIINILQLQSLILWLKMFLIQDYHKSI